MKYSPNNSPIPQDRPGMFQCPIGKDVNMKLSLGSWACTKDAAQENDAEMDPWLTLIHEKELTDLKKRQGTN